MSSYPFPPNLLVPNNKYYWRVVAANDSGSGSYSETRSFFISNNITSVRSSSGNNPDIYSMSQNFPNPFNPSTSIIFQLKKESSVTLQVYNELGQKIFEKQLGALNSGKHQINVDLSRYASGIYFYRMVALNADGNKLFSTKKMELLK